MDWQVPAAQLHPRPAYPTLGESWAIVGWYLLATLVAGGASYLLLAATTALPRVQQLLLAAAAANVALLAFLRWKAGTRRQSWEFLGQARAWHFAALPAVVVAGQLLLSLLHYLHLPDTTGAKFQELSNSLVAALLLGAVAAPVLEELLFRGLVLNGLLRNCPPWAAIGQSALLFGLIHFNPAQSMSAGMLGLLLGWLYYRTRSLGLCVVLHAVNNGLGLAAMHLATPAIQKAESMADVFGSSGQYIGSLLVSAVVLAGYLWGVQRTTQIEPATL
ncbi:MAG TPA: CPBP family intramembrane glutamic endopeptidase [Hymenobacter sp.]|uniref:CPBP family intramembrane glutamic endopeptidase n=1 Tax=Hymenobacter sp. TaxID=1898978 RepID=UPI002ED99EDF